MRRYAFLALIPVIFALDRVTKYLIMQDLPILGEIKINSFFSIVHVRNFGGVFGILNQGGYARYIFLGSTHPRCRCPDIYTDTVHNEQTPGPLRCRLFSQEPSATSTTGSSYGSVVDFLDLYYGNHHWPAFNVADIAVSVGIGLIVFLEIVAGKKEGVPKE